MTSVLRGIRWPVALLALAAVPLLSLGACDDLRSGQLMRTANALGAQAKWAEALHYYERLWVEMPNHPAVDEARLRAARIYAGPERKFSSAIDIYQHLALNARDQDLRVTALREMARLFKENGGSSERALELMEVHLRRYPEREDSALVRLELVDLYLDAQRLTQAIDAALPILKHHDARIAARANLLVGMAKELARQPAAALSDFETAIALDADKGDTWLGAMAGRARALDAIDRRAEALQTAKDLRDRHPNPEAIERWLAALEKRHEDMNR